MEFLRLLIFLRHRMDIYTYESKFDIPLADTRVVVYKFIDTLWYSTYIVRTRANYI